MGWNHQLDIGKLISQKKNMVWMHSVHLQHQ